MLYQTAKEFIALHLEGDNSQSKPTMQHFNMAFIDILTRCEPYTHISTFTGIEKDVFREIHPILGGDKEYLRLPNLNNISDTDPMDIDEALALAVVFFICSYFSKRQGGKRSYEERAEKIINIYTANQVVID